MSQTKVQLIAPIGVVTATTLETTGVLTATTFVGDIAGTVTGITSTTDNLNLGIITATSFAGDFTGIGSGLTGTPNVVAGVVTATKFVGNTPGLVSGIADGTNINAGIITATSFVGNITGNAAGLSTTTSHANLGIVTATSFHGSGANLEGVSSGPVAQQAVTADGATTTIDLSSGNLIYMTQTADTTVAFASTEGNTDVVYLIRVKDASTTARTITWPSGLVWSGGSAPTLLNINDTEEAQVFKLTTRDNGATWYGLEVVSYPSGYDLYTWGKNAYGALGQNSTTDYSSPIQIPGLWNNLKLNEVSEHSVYKKGGNIWVMGRNNEGQLGVNNTTQYSSPVQVPGTATWNKVDAARFETFGIKTDGTLWGWGKNLYGALAQNNTTSYSSPVQVPGTTWSDIVATDSGFNALKTDGTLWACGYGDEGNLAQNNRTKYSSPVQIPGTTWSTLSSASYTQSAAIKTDGTLWTWGYNDKGQLGQNQSFPGLKTTSSPVQIPGTTWSNICCGRQGPIATKTNGTLWVWGANETGGLGQNSVSPGGVSSPIQIPGTTWSLTEIRSISSGEGNMAMKTDGTLWVWGTNQGGSLGQNNETQYSSPTQVPGTDWNVLGGGKSIAVTKSRS